MKTNELSSERFEDLSRAELFAIGGEGFAYDAGRFLRFIGLAASGTIGLQQAMLEIAIDSVI